MRYPYLILVIICTCLGIKASAQQVYTIKGVVSKKLSMDRVAGTVITNLRSKDINYSDELGWFTVKAAIGDTLLFTKEDYTDQKITITGPGDLPVYMQPVIKLSTVTIQGQTKRQELNEVMGDYRKQGTFYNGKPPVLSFLTNPLTGLYELFGSTPGRARRFAAYSKGELEYAEIRKRYNVAFIKKITGATDTVARQFMEYYTPSIDDIKEWSDYELIRQTKKSYNYYDKNKDKVSLQNLNSPIFTKPTKDTVKLSKN